MGKRTELRTSSGHVPWGMKVRSRIDSTLIVQRLQRVALGLEDATQTEINASRILLAKTLPDIAPMKPESTGDGGNAKTITNDQLLNIIEGQVERIE